MGRVSAFVNNTCRRRRLEETEDAKGSRRQVHCRFRPGVRGDIARMGGKCASLSRMIAAGVHVPDGFAVTTDAYAEHLESGRLAQQG